MHDELERRGVVVSYFEKIIFKWFFKTNQNFFKCDFRAPDVLRFAPAPLYNTFSDIFNMIRILEKSFDFVQNKQ